MNRLTPIMICLFVQALAVVAQESDSTVRVASGTMELFPVLNPWLATSNPAGMRFNADMDAGDLTLNYNSENGSYKRAQEGDSLESYFLRTSSYKRMKNTWFYGNFQYEKSYERNCNYNLVNDPYRLTPYLLIDTMARNDVYDREFFNLRGDMSTPFARHFSYGLSVNMDVGLAAQDRDPRPRNKVMNLDVSQGFLFTNRGFSLGLNMLYSYYNEDIEADIIEENVQHAFLQLHGFDRYTYHVASSFNRLYQRSTYGGEGQLGLQLGGLHSIFGAKFLYLVETADDGRKAGNASWSYMKNDSELQGNLLSVYNTSTYSHGKFHHYLEVSNTVRYMLGAEIIQRLEQVGEAGAVDWVDYGREEKYGATYSDLAFSYTFLMMKEKYLRNVELNLGMAYREWDQGYYLPDRTESARNREIGGSVKKAFYLGLHEFTIGAGMNARKSLSAIQDPGTENFINEILTRPDFEYKTRNTTGKWISASWAVKLNRIFDHYFWSMQIGSINTENSTNRKYINVRTGVIF